MRLFLFPKQLINDPAQQKEKPERRENFSMLKFSEGKCSFLSKAG